MAFVLFEDALHLDFRPFTFTRPVYQLRTGIFTIQQRWDHLLSAPTLGWASDSLAPYFRQLPPAPHATWINARFLPDEDFLRLISDLPPHTACLSEQGHVLVAKLPSSLFHQAEPPALTAQALGEQGIALQAATTTPRALERLADLFVLNGALIAYDISLLTRQRQFVPLKDPYTQVYGRDNLFVEAGAQVRASVINAEEGPIYIGHGAQVQEGALIRRPHAICAHASVSMGAKLRGDSTIGPYCKAGGEITNSILMGYSSKSHDGYLGNSLLGYWCNMGADSNTSNLKNNYSSVKQWSYRHEAMVDTGLQFCGLTMGDHSKCGINTMFNTGTVVGVSANLFGGDFLPKFVPSFSWGGAHGLSTYRLPKALEVARRVMQRRQVVLSDPEEQLLRRVFEESEAYRHAHHSPSFSPSRLS